jgi:hypothetical protein
LKDVLNQAMEIKDIKSSISINELITSLENNESASIDIPPNPKKSVYTETILDISRPFFKKGNWVSDKSEYNGLWLDKADAGEISWAYTCKEASNYKIEFDYASLASRPVSIIFNGEVITEAGLTANTGSWDGSSYKTDSYIVPFKRGNNVITIKHIKNPSPHIKLIRIIK